MPYIQTIHESEAAGDLADLYQRVGNPDGTVDNVMKIHSLNPATLRTHFEMYVEAMHKPSPLTRAEREMVAVVVSRLNGCRYCLTHHHAGLVRLLPDEREPDADALRDDRTADLSEREQAMTEYAAALTTTPTADFTDHIGALKRAGLDDRAILDLAQLIGYFNYVNRIVNGLGVDLGDGEGSAGQWPGQEGNGE